MPPFLPTGQRMTTDTDAWMDAALVEHAARRMTEKLAASRAKGRGGWWNEKLCETSHLRRLLDEHGNKGNDGNMVDIAILAMMIDYRTGGDD